MVRVRFAPSPTGALHLGSALTAVANRRFADERHGAMVLRIDDTDAERSDREAEPGLLADLEWLGIGWDEGPVRQSERGELYRNAATQLLEAGRAYEEHGAVRFDLERRPTLLRPDGSATYHLATVVDDIELRISHVIRGRDHLPNAPLHEAIARALRRRAARVRSPRAARRAGRGQAVEAPRGDLGRGAEGGGDSPEAVRAYLEELGLPHADVQLDLARVRRLSIDAIQGLSDEDLCARVGAPVRLAAALRGARTLVEARETAGRILDTPSRPQLDEQGRLTAERFRELREAAADELAPDEARALVRELKAVGGDLRALRLVLTGAESGPELWAVLAALSRDEALARVNAAL